MSKAPDATPRSSDPPYYGGPAVRATVTDGNAKDVRVLVIAIEQSLLAARVSMALVNVGFRIATLSPRGHFVRKLRRTKEHFSYHTRPRFKSTIRAIERWSPDLLVCADDLAVRELQILHQRMVTSKDKMRGSISKLIETSIGPATSFPAMVNKSDLLTRAKIEGVRCPTTVVLPASRGLSSAPAELTYPTMVKADRSHGGRCVRMVSSAINLRTAVWELQIPYTWRLRRLIGALLGSKTLCKLMIPLRRTISLQQFIKGRPSNRAVICWRGKVLAGISVEAVEVTEEFGPASVVRTIEHPEMALAAERMVKCLELSGFIGFDFILDSSDQAWLIEMNPRATPICHFSLDDDTNLAGSLYRHLTGACPRSTSVTFGRGLIALFPNEIVRRASSEHLQFGQHDVPWEEPQLVRAALNKALGLGIRQRIRLLLEDYLPAVVNALVKLRLVDPRRDNGRMR
jgi:glutathione synthase/RimK-type ligase-like ATP-grasp enzyme